MRAEYVLSAERHVWKFLKQVQEYPLQAIGFICWALTFHVHTHFMDFFVVPFWLEAIQAACFANLLHYMP